MLPSSLIDFVCSPLPYIIGINPASCQRFDDMDMDEAVVIHLDKGKFLKKVSAYIMGYVHSVGADTVIRDHAWKCPLYRGLITPRGRIKVIG